VLLDRRLDKLRDHQHRKYQPERRLRQRRKA
jgi:hypothetical protein